MQRTKLGKCIKAGHKLPHTIHIHEGENLERIRLLMWIQSAIVAMATHYRRYLGSNGSQNPENALQIEHPPKIRRILLVQDADKHDTEECQFHQEIDKETPAENARPGNDTCVCNRAPHGLGLQRTYSSIKTWA
jgi:hypothetical protein